jgi:hypothetical protein
MSLEDDDCDLGADSSAMDAVVQWFRVYQGSIMR